MLSLLRVAMNSPMQNWHEPNLTIWEDNLNSWPLGHGSHCTPPPPTPFKHCLGHKRQSGPCAWSWCCDFPASMASTGRELFQHGPGFLPWAEHEKQGKVLCWSGFHTMEITWDQAHLSKPMICASVNNDYIPPQFFPISIECLRELCRRLKYSLIHVLHLL